MNGHFAAGRSHRDAQVPGRQGGCVVDAVADDRDTVALGFHLPDEFHFVLRQTFAQDFFAANLAGHAGRHRLAVARNHRDAPHPCGLQTGQRFPRLGTGLVLQPDPADALPPASDKDQTEAFGFIQINRLEEIIGHFDL